MNKELLEIMKNVRKNYKEIHEGLVAEYNKAVADKAPKTKISSLVSNANSIRQQYIEVNNDIKEYIDACKKGDKKEMSELEILCIMDYAPEFTSMVYPNDESGQLAKLKAEYGAKPGNIKDVILLAPESQVETRKSEYPDLEVHSIGFDSSELSVKDWMFLLGAMGNDSTYIKELKQIMKACRNDMSLVNIRNGVANSSHMSSSQRSLAEQKLDFAEEYITDGNKLQQYLKPGRLIIVDLRDEFIEKDEALGLFVVMLNIFSSVMRVDGQAFNKFIVFDEAHKYMNNKELVSSITTAIREMRHKGVSIMIASQDPMSLPTEIIELSSIVVMHRFSSPAWVKHVQKAITPLQTLTATEMAALGSGEAYLWANKASDKAITQRPIKISIRPRVTKHGGDTIQAVK